MTRDDIIRMAREAGLERVVELLPDGTRTVETLNPAALERFAALVAAHERQSICKQIATLHDSLMMTSKETQ